MPKKKEVCADVSKLAAMVDLVPDDRKQVAEKLVNELVFMGRTLDALKAAVDAGGVVDLFRQGKDEYYRESPALKSYNTTIQRYSLILKQLVDMLPKQAQGTAESALLDFVRGEDG